jgi:hypothetical protein
MTSIQEIERAIAQLPRREFFELVRRLQERHWEEWDRQIEEDSRAGLLDPLLSEAEKEIAEGKTRPLGELLDG